jgi:hypothetical protein
MLANVRAKRIGIEKRGDSIAIFISLIDLHFDDTAVLSNVVLESSAGKVR